MSLKTEFEKAFDDAGYAETYTPIDIALWAARWMGERCAEKANNLTNVCDSCRTAENLEEIIRQLIEELE